MWIISCDESCIDANGGHEVLCVGGIAIEDRQANLLEEATDRWKDGDPLRQREFHFSKMGKGPVAIFEQFARGGLARINEGLMSFRSVVFKHEDIDTEKFHDGSDDLQLLRFYYQLLFYPLLSVIPDGEDVLIRPDHKNLSGDVSWPDLRDSLRRGIRMRGVMNGGPYHNIVDVQPAQSHMWNLGQFSDVFLGAVQFFNNRRDLTECSAKKLRVATAIAQGTGREHLRANTPRHERHFGVWQFDFGAGRRKRAPKTLADM